jgi:hypothetical protein
MKRPTRPDPAQVLRQRALQYPEAEEGIACEGTALEKRTIRARGKAFLFLGAADAMLKLSASLPEATALAAAEPGRYEVGAHGWATISFGDVASLPVEVLLRWVDESYRLLAPKKLVAELSEKGPPTAVGPATPKAKTRKKGSE